MNDTQRSGDMYTVQQRMAQLARERPQECFTALNHYLNVSWLKAAYERVKPDSAPGVDGQSWSDYGKDLEGNLRRLLDRAKSGSYVAPPVKRVHIPKGESQQGRWVIRRKTARKRLGRSLRAISQGCRENLHEPLRQQVEQLGGKLKGHFGYYGLTGNLESLRRYRWEVIKIWRKWLARRGDPKGMSWERMHRLLEFFYLPEAGVVHSIYAAKPWPGEPYA